MVIVVRVPSRYAQRVKRIYLILLLLACFPAMGIAGVYTWVDENGVRQFSDRPPTGDVTQVETVEVPEISTVMTRIIPIDALKLLNIQAKQQVKERKRVLMYSAAWCGVCKRAKRYFSNKKIPYQEKDIDKSRQARQAFIKLGGKGVPLILVGKRQLSGFSPASFEQLYAD